MSIVKMVELELKMEVKEDIKAANITAIINPLIPSGIKFMTKLINAELLQPLSLPQNF